MKNYYKTLIVHDHGLTNEGIKVDLQKVTESTGITFETYFATKYPQALSILKKESLIDIIFLDFKNPPEFDSELYSGQDFGIEIRKSHPNILIVVTMSEYKPIYIRSVLKSLNPEGFIVKRDVHYLGLAHAIKETLHNPPYYSPTVIEYYRSIEGFIFTLSKREIRLLKELDNGLTLNEIGEVIALSKSAVAIRKKKLKSLFGVEDGNDRDLIRKARETGYI